MHIHILGICGTFMGGIALLAREAGHKVSGSDENVYPPMSTQLEQQGIELMQGYDPQHLNIKPDMVVIGNVMSRGNPLVEAVLEQQINYTSGPQWLFQHILRDRWVLAVSGTHGKTSTASMLAWILESAGLTPGFLIGGVPENFGLSARLGKAPFFVVEADEYDTAFFDKRSKFVHYRPKTLAINNLEFDHADIFNSLDDIKRQFHHLIRMVPANGQVIVNAVENNINDVLQQGCWTPVIKFSDRDSVEAEWRAVNCSADGSRFDIQVDGGIKGQLEWSLIGMHNVQNAMSAIIAAHHAGVTVEKAIVSLNSFENVKRRLELKADINGIRVYDDFAHHPTAITSTLEGLRGRVGKQRIIALLEPRSNTMRMGVHKDALANSLISADQVILYQPTDLSWDLGDTVKALQDAKIYNSIDTIVEVVSHAAKNGDHILIMSNGAFGDIHTKLVDALNGSK